MCFPNKLFLTTILLSTSLYVPDLQAEISIINNDPVMNYSNNIAISGNNTVTNLDDTKIVNINNVSGGVTAGSMTVTNGTLITRQVQFQG